MMIIIIVIVIIMISRGKNYTSPPKRLKFCNLVWLLINLNLNTSRVTYFSALAISMPNQYT